MDDAERDEAGSEDSDISISLDDLGLQFAPTRPIYQGPSPTESPTVEKRVESYEAHPTGLHASAAHTGHEDGVGEDIGKLDGNGGAKGIKEIISSSHHGNKESGVLPWNEESKSPARGAGSGSTATHGATPLAKEGAIGEGLPQSSREVITRRTSWIADISDGSHDSGSPEVSRFEVPHAEGVQQGAVRTELGTLSSIPQSSTASGGQEQQQQQQAGKKDSSQPHTEGGGGPSISVPSPSPEASSPPTPHPHEPPAATSLSSGPPSGATVPPPNTSGSSISLHDGRPSDDTVTLKSWREEGAWRDGGGKRDGTTNSGIRRPSVATRDSQGAGGTGAGDESSSGAGVTGASSHRGLSRPIEGDGASSPNSSSSPSGALTFPQPGRGTTSAKSRGKDATPRPVDSGGAGRRGADGSMMVSHGGRELGSMVGPEGGAMVGPGGERRNGIGWSGGGTNAWPESQESDTGDRGDGDGSSPSWFGANKGELMEQLPGTGESPLRESYGSSSGAGHGGGAGALAARGSGEEGGSLAPLVCEIPPPIQLLEPVVESPRGRGGGRLSRGGSRRTSDADGVWASAVGHAFSAGDVGQRVVGDVAEGRGEDMAEEALRERVKSIGGEGDMGVPARGSKHAGGNGKSKKSRGRGARTDKGGVGRATGRHQGHGESSSPKRRGAREGVGIHEGRMARAMRGGGHSPEGGGRSSLRGDGNVSGEVEEVSGWEASPLGGPSATSNSDYDPWPRGICGGPEDADHSSAGDGSGGDGDHGEERLPSGAGAASSKGRRKQKKLGKSKGTQGSPHGTRSQHGTPRGHGAGSSSKGREPGGASTPQRGARGSRESAGTLSREDHLRMLASPRTHARVRTRRSGHDGSRDDGASAARDPGSTGRTRGGAGSGRAVGNRGGAMTFRRDGRAAGEVDMQAECVERLLQLGHDRQKRQEARELEKAAKERAFLKTYRKVLPPEKLEANTERLFQEAEMLRRSKRELEREQRRKQRAMSTPKMSRASRVLMRNALPLDERIRAFSEMRTARRHEQEEERRQREEAEVVHHSSPKILPQSKQMRRSVDDLLAWGQHRRESLESLRAERDKAEVEACAFSPTIDLNSRLMEEGRRGPEGSPMYLMTASPEYRRDRSPLAVARRERKKEEEAPHSPRIDGHSAWLAELWRASQQGPNSGDARSLYDRLSSERLRNTRPSRATRQENQLSREQARRSIGRGTSSGRKHNGDPRAGSATAAALNAGGKAVSGKPRDARKHPMQVTNSKPERRPEAKASRNQPWWGNARPQPSWWGTRRSASAPVRPRPSPGSREVPVEALRRRLAFDEEAGRLDGSTARALTAALDGTRVAGLWGRKNGMSARAAQYMPPPADVAPDQFESRLPWGSKVEAPGNIRQKNTQAAGPRYQQGAPVALEQGQGQLHSRSGSVGFLGDAALDEWAVDVGPHPRAQGQESGPWPRAGDGDPQVAGTSVSPRVAQILSSLLLATTARGRTTDSLGAGSLEADRAKQMPEGTSSIGVNPPEPAVISTRVDRGSFAAKFAKGIFKAYLQVPSTRTTGVQ
eukprot:jgi/Mesvir1/18015/Mv09346-RA.1